jgi:hypothetical protein
MVRWSYILRVSVSGRLKHYLHGTVVKRAARDTAIYSQRIPVSKCSSLSSSLDRHFIQSAITQPADHQALRSSVDPVSDACYQKLGIIRKELQVVIDRVPRLAPLFQPLFHVCCPEKVMSVN